MSRAWYLAFCMCAASSIVALVPSLRAVDPEADEKLLKQALGSTDPDKVIGYLREQTLTDAAREKYLPLIQQLGDKVFRKREEASRKLIEAGPVVMPLLREAMAPVPYLHSQSLLSSAVPTQRLLAPQQRPTTQTAKP